MQNWILMAQNSKGQNLRACSQIAEDEIPSLEAANRLADKLEREEPGFIVKEAYRIHKDMSREELEALDFFPRGCLAEVGWGRWIISSYGMVQSLLYTVSCWRAK